MLAQLSDDDPSEFQLNDLYLNLLKKLYKGDLNDIDIPTTLDNAQTFMSGVFSGFGGDFSAFEYDTPDYDKLAHLERNVYQFSGAKNYHQLRALTDAVKDTTTFQEFKNKALTILDEFQGSWLRTEYNAAVAGSQMASKWVSFENSAKLNGPDNTLLEYRTMEDDRVREEHQELDRIVRPMNDDFWKTYYPPNGWNCRCTVIALNDGTPSAAKDMAYPDIPKMFQVNLGQEGLVFPKTSPYFVGIPKEVKEKINSLIPDRTK